MIDRRSFGLAAAAAAVTAGPSRAGLDAPLFPSGPMAANRIGALFTAAPASMVLPDTPLISAEGARKLSDVRDRTWLVSLWAEWCAPCLQEATDLAAVARRHGGPSFGLIFVLTGSNKRLDLPAAQALLAKRGAADAPLFVEPNGGRSVLKTLATRQFPPEMRAVTKQESGVSLPCNLLVDRRGRVRGRAFGAPQVGAGQAGSPSQSGAPVGPHMMTDADKARALETHTIWATPAGDEFAAALAAGLLERA